MQNCVLETLLVVEYMTEITAQIFFELPCEIWHQS
jgi:hypothetical protein